MVVHFVCTGNSYRSRLAEDYFSSVAAPGWRANSSGIMARRNLHGPITWYAARIIQAQRLVPFMSPSWQQTDRDLLHAADCIVFMTEEQRAFCPEHFQMSDERTAVWAKPDVDDVVMPEAADHATRERFIMAETEGTYRRISELVDDLTARLAAEASSELQSG